MSFQLRREEVLDGDQLSAMLAENPAKAAQAILMAAKEGIVDGQALLGQILLDGQGIERDPVLAKRWFQISANAGHLMARNMLGRCWEHGWGGPVDCTLASLEYRRCHRTSDWTGSVFNAWPEITGVDCRIQWQCGTHGTGATSRVTQFHDPPPANHDATAGFRASGWRTGTLGNRRTCLYGRRASRKRSICRPWRRAPRTQSKTC